MKVCDWYENGKDFEAVLEAAIDNAEQPNERQFVDDMDNNHSKYGFSMYLSGAQNDWLRNIAKRGGGRLPELKGEER